MIAKALDGEYTRIRPDFAIEGPNGKPNDIYDFKFDDPYHVDKNGRPRPYQDSWENNPGQKELYDDMLEDTGKQTKKISPDTCRCRKSGNV